MNFPALKHRNYRLFFMGQGLSFVGTWMQSVATSWIVFRLTNSTALLGVTSFASQIISFVLSPLAGVVVENVDKKKLLFFTQIIALIQALILAILIVLGRIHVWHIIFLNVVLGMVNAFDMPARQSFVIDLVDHKKDDLRSAIAMNSSLFNGARIIGPMIAGLLIGKFGEKICFILNAISYLFILLALGMMKVDNSSVVSEKMTKTYTWLKASFQEGFAFVRGSSLISSSMIMLMIASIFGLSFVVLLPVYASRVFHGDASVFGLLTSASGVGAFFASLFLGMKNDSKNLEKYIFTGAIVFIAGLFLLSLSNNLYLSMLFLFFVGAGSLINISSTNTLIQMMVPDAFRGRVMSIYIMAFMGAAPLGSIVTGSIAEVIGVKKALFFNALCFAICLAWLIFYFQKKKDLMDAHSSPSVS